MDPVGQLGLSLLLFGLVATLAADSLEKRAVGYVAKPAASIGFLLVAVGSGALDSTYGLWVLVGLGLSLVGDVFLMFRDQATFLAGLVSFLLAHVAYVVAFLVIGVSGATVFAATGGVGAVAGAVAYWLIPKVDRPMVASVMAYIAVISVMVVLAAGAYGAGHSILILGGALLFFVSDLFVARQRFVTEGFTNRLVGLPLYYAGQVLLALSVAA